MDLEPAIIDGFGHLEATANTTLTSLHPAEVHAVLSKQLHVDSWSLLTYYYYLFVNLLLIIISFFILNT